MIDGSWTHDTLFNGCGWTWKNSKELSMCQAFGTNCKDLISMIQDPQAWLNFSTELKELSRLKNRFSDFSIVFISCSGNVSFDSLTKIAKKFHMDLYYIGCHIIRKHGAFLDTCRLTKQNVSCSSYYCDLPHEIFKNFNRRSISVFCPSTDSIDLTTKPDLEDEGASRNEEFIEENNAEFVEQAMVEKMRDCVLSRGSWVKDDDEYPLYQPGSYDLNWRWKPDGCDLPWGSKIKAMWMLDVTTPSMESQMSVDFAKLFTNSSFYRRNHDFIKKLSIPPPELKYLYFRTKYSQLFFTQTKACFLKHVMLGLEQDMNNFFGAMYAAILFLGATNAATVELLSPLSVLFSTEKELLECGRGNHEQHGTTGVYVLILYSMIGYDWTVAKSMGSACPSSLVSGITSPVYSDQDRYVANNDMVEMIAGVGDMCLKTLLKYGFGFEHDFLPVVADVHIGYILLLFVFGYVFAYGIKFLNFQKNVKEK
ncbi:hypothetical protein IGI04_019430 [Brassica rapa subsp. trilocularis]|uniref:Trichome birefringence-like N-terminal domain-containing protein n=1 Tax=Brassica rapa subsp. trilocularis TaxID=1813537 RepID=A0ABQ7MI80_BRACM|nr:hypothetical protein IGI04_019430 [Brassica rapa subsp. trilocularis]